MSPGVRFPRSTRPRRSQSLRPEPGADLRPRGQAADHGSVVFQQHGAQASVPSWSSKSGDAARGGEQTGDTSALRRRSPAGWSTRTWQAGRHPGGVVISLEEQAGQHDRPGRQAAQFRRAAQSNECKDGRFRDRQSPAWRKLHASRTGPCGPQRQEGARGGSQPSSLGPRLLVRRARAR